MRERTLEVEAVPAGRHGDTVRKGVPREIRSQGLLDRRLMLEHSGGYHGLESTLRSERHNKICSFQEAFVK